MSACLLVTITPSFSYHALWPLPHAGHTLVCKASVNWLECNHRMSVWRNSRWRDRKGVDCLCCHSFRDHEHGCLFFTPCRDSWAATWEPQAGVGDYHTRSVEVQTNRTDNWLLTKCPGSICMPCQLQNVMWCTMWWSRQMVLFSRIWWFLL